MEELYSELYVEYKLTKEKYGEIELQSKVEIDPTTDSAVSISPKYILCSFIECQLRIVSCCSEEKFFSFIYIKYLRIHVFKNDFKFILNINIPKLKIVNKQLTGPEDTWILVHEYKANPSYSLLLDISIDIDSKVDSYSLLYNDENLIDFELKGEDGIVSVHRTVLAMASPVLHRMLSGSWKEKSQKHLEVPASSKSTLQHFKDYLYLHTLPETGLEQLLLLSVYYMIPDLEWKCINKLMNNLNAENTCDMLEFASKNKVTGLLLAIMYCLQNQLIVVDDILRHITTTTETKEENDGK